MTGPKTGEFGPTSDLFEKRPNDGRPTCQIDGCEKPGVRTVNKVLMCEACRSYHRRRQGNLCSVRGCTGPVKLGTRRTVRYCRTHEARYLTDRPRRTEAALREVASRIGIDNLGDNHCWMEIGETGRATIKVDNLTWLITRFLWTHFYGPIKGRNQLHHVCGNSWCLNVSHCWPMPQGLNNDIEKKLNEYPGEDFVSRFAPITEEFDSWCRANGLDHGMIEEIDSGARRYIEAPVTR